MECCCQESSDFLSKASDIGNVIMAIASFALAFYIFVYQRGKERLDGNLQAFRELILDPNKNTIYTFYREFAEISEQLSRPGITDSEKSVVFDQIKQIISSFRKEFINLLFVVDPAMARNVLRSIDFALDMITRSAFDPTIDLSDRFQLDQHVTMIIHRNRNFLFEKILSYNGSRPKKLGKVPPVKKPLTDFYRWVRRIFK